MAKDLESIINSQREEATKIISGYEIELEKVRELLSQRMRTIDSLKREREYIQRVIEEPKKRLSAIKG